MSWPEDRPGTYDEDKVWDEATETWVSNDGRGGARYQNQIIIINEQGQIYFSSV